ENAKKFNAVKEKFDSYFIKRRNTIFERAKFNTRKQEVGESVDSFITDLYCLAKYCNYGALNDEMIRDRIIQGRLPELVKKQQAVVRGTEGQASQPITVEAVHKNHQQRANRQKPGQKKPKGGARSSAPSRSPQNQGHTSCSRCGKSPAHGRSQCPAKEATCLKCKKKGHYQAVGRSERGTVNSLDDNDSYLGAVYSKEINSVAANPWKVVIAVNEIKIEFKLDTGADVSVIPETEFKKLNIELKNTSKILTGPSQQNLNPIQSTPEEIYQKFPKLFEGLGKLDGEYHIDLKEDSKPYAVATPRRVPLPLMEKVTEELAKMETQGVISRIDKATDWCAPMVVVPKSNGKVRICVDFTKLNDCVRRERHVLPSVEHTLAQMGGGKVFTKLDANSGFYQIALSKDSTELTTFITPVGRFCFNRLPFGITSAPEHFQKRMSAILSGLEGTLCMIGDVLITGATQAEHDQRLTAALERIQNAGVTLNKEKCEFSKETVTFLGQVISATGVQPDPEKVKAIVQMKEPENTSDVKRFLGMANQLGKYSDKLSDLSKPLRELLSSKNDWHWGQAQVQSFSAIKKELSSPDAILAHYNAKLDTIVSADASSYGLGAVLLQKQPNNHWRPVAYHSRALTETEQRYAQIEKEALATTWACERFSDYLVGKSFHIQTDHKPLVPLLGSKDIDGLPPRIQRFRMRLMRFHYTIEHVPGKDLFTADALSRAPLPNMTPADLKLQDDVYLFVNHVIESLPASEMRREEIRKHQEEDDICHEVVLFRRKGWPEKSQLKGPIKLYQPYAAELTVQNGLLLKGCQLVIPLSMRMEMLDRIHAGHQGITKCRARARQAVWWPGMSRQIEELGTELC
ncbi:hypothetical protein QZH41_019571, partial [Actinostola sp. cb2023]